MSILVTFNNASFIIPTPGEVGWGTNLDNYFVAIAAGALQKSGGNFVLSAETDFGASFGLKSLYYLSRTANPAGTGILRLANNSDAVSWRNAANNADLPLMVNNINQLLFNGNVVGVTPTSLTPNRAVQTDGSGTLSVSATTSTELGYVSGVTSSIQTQLDSHVLTGTAGRLSLYPSNGTAVSDTYTQNANTINLAIAAQPTRSTGLVYTFPNPGDAVAAASVVLTQGTQTIVGSTTLSAFSGALNGNIAAAGNKLTGLGAGTTAGDSLRYEQNHVPHVPVFANTQTQTSSSSTSFVAVTNLIAPTVSPTSTSSKFLIIATFYTEVPAGETGYYTIHSSLGPTDFGGTNGLGRVTGGTAGADVMVTLQWLDSPASVSNIDYSIRFKSSAGSSINAGGAGGVAATITVQEFL